MSSTNLILNQKTRSILVSPSLFDGATIIDSSGSDAGFPIANLKDFQPKRKWHHSPGGDPIATHFVVDLGASAPGRVWNCAIPLFHNGFVDPELNRWRVQTGDTPTGVGFYDSDWMPLWQSPVPVNGGPNNYKSTAFYRTRGLGAHSHFVLPRQVIQQGVGAYLQFRGGSVGFGDVLDQDSIGGGDVMQVYARVRITKINVIPFTWTILQKGIDNVLTGASSSGGGYSLAMQDTGALVATFHDGGGIVTTLDTTNFSAFLRPGWNDVVFEIRRAQANMSIWLNGETVASALLLGATAQSSADPLVWGRNSAGGQVATGMDMERVAFLGESGLGDLGKQEVFDADLRSIDIPSSWDAAAVYPNDAGLGSNVEDVEASGFDGAISGDVFWNTENIPTSLFNRYARFDFESSNTPTWTLGRFYMGLALEPITPYGTSMPTPVGTPPKPQTSWVVRLTREKFESIAYALAADTGNNPDVLRSWGHDTHLIDGGKPVVSVNNIAAEFPWQRQQQTVYGYISALDEVRTMNTGLIEANLTVTGM